MPRTARIDIADNYYHVITRGNDKRKIFLQDSDKDYFLTKLFKYAEEYNFDIHAFCLMINHIHILIYRREKPLYRLFHRLFTDYAVYFNNKYEHTGHVFTSRFLSKIVLDETYLYRVLYYIHMNPVRAGLVKSAEMYKYSSERFYRGQNFRYNIKKIFEDRGDMRTYSEYINKTEDMEFPVYKDSIGVKKEYEKLEKRKEGREKGKFKERREIGDIERLEIKNIIKNHLNFNEEKIAWIFSSSRDKDKIRLKNNVVWKLYTDGYSMADIARVFNNNISTISRIIKKLEKI